MKRFILIAALLLSCSISHSVTWQDIQQGNNKDIKSAGGSFLYFKLHALKLFTREVQVQLQGADGLVHSHTCNEQNPNSTFKLIRGDDSMDFYSTLLTAYTASRKINISYSCINNNAYIRGIRLSHKQ